MSSMTVHSTPSLAPTAQTYTGGDAAVCAVVTPPASYGSFLSRPAHCSLESGTSDRTTQREVLNYISLLTGDLTLPSTSTESSPDSDLKSSQSEHKQDVKSDGDEASSDSGTHTLIQNALHTALCSKQVRPFLDGDDHLDNQGSEVIRPAELDQETWETIMQSLRKLEPNFWKALQNRVCRAKIVTHRRHPEGGRNGPVLVKRRMGKNGIYAMAVGIPVGLIVLLVGGVMYVNKWRHEQQAIARSVPGSMHTDMELGRLSQPRSRRHR